MCIKRVTDSKAGGQVRFGNIFLILPLSFLLSEEVNNESRFMRVLIPFLHLQELFKCTAIHNNQVLLEWHSHATIPWDSHGLLGWQQVGYHPRMSDVPLYSQLSVGSRAMPFLTDFPVTTCQKTTFSLVFELRGFKIVNHQHLGDVISHRGSWSWVIQVDEHARLLRIDMEEAGKSSQMGKAEVPAFESFISLLLWDWPLVPGSARPDMPQQGCCIQTESPAAHPSRCLGQKDPVTHHDTWHTSLHVVTGSSSLHLWLCSR